MAAGSSAARGASAGWDPTSDPRSRGRDGLSSAGVRAAGVKDACSLLFSWWDGPAPAPQMNPGVAQVPCRLRFGRRGVALPNGRRRGRDRCVSSQLCCVTTASVVTAWWPSPGPLALAPRAFVITFSPQSWGGPLWSKGWRQPVPPSTVLVVILRKGVQRPTPVGEGHSTTRDHCPLQLRWQGAADATRPGKRTSSSQRTPHDFEDCKWKGR